MSAESVHKAIYGFWAQFGLPVYIQGRVPTKEPLPYITIEILIGESLSTAYPVAVTWHQARDGGPNVNAERAELLTRISNALPDGGVTLPLEDGGCLLLHRNGSGWQSYIDDEEDKSVIGGRISYAVTYIT